MFYAFQAWSPVYWRGVCLAHRQGHFLVYSYSHVALDAGTSTSEASTDGTETQIFFANPYKFLHQTSGLDICVPGSQ